MTAHDPATPSLPSSYWHATFSPPVPDDQLPVGTDVAVIGGGMLGCWTAYWLAKRGIEVTVIEREAVSWGATGRNGGFLTGGGALGYGEAVDSFGRESARAVWTISAEGRALAEETIAVEDIDCDFRRPGILWLGLTDESMTSTRRSIDVLTSDGFAVELLDRESVQEMVGTPLGEEIAGGRLDRDGGLLHSGRYLAGVAEAAKRHGARFCRATVTGLSPSANGTRIATSEGNVHAGRVVVAANAWSDEIVPALEGVIVPVRGQILSYAPTERIFETGIGTDVTPTGEYWQQTPDGSIVIGGCRADAPNGDKGVREMVPTPVVTRSIEAVLPRLFPQMDRLRVSRSWAGLMAFTSDYLPVADEVPGMPGVWAGGGFCGHGMPFGPRIGQLLAEAAATGETPDALHPFRLDRETLTRLA
jgi:glycine/D-amino acid oxidase-like deaminating enzyme